MAEQSYLAWTAVNVTDLITEGTIIEIRVIARRNRAPRALKSLPGHEQKCR